MDLPLTSMSTLQSKAASADFAGNPALYESLIGFTPDYLNEAQRLGLGEVGVAVPARIPGRTVEAPPSGDHTMYQGAGLWFVQCGAQSGAALRHALEVGFEQIVEDVLLVYPLMPGFAITGVGTNRRNYIVEPIELPAHQYWHAGSARASFSKETRSG